MLRAPEDLLRELIYGLNVLLLEVSPALPSGALVTARLLQLIETGGHHLGAPALLQAWEEQVGPTLRSQIAAALDLILEELADQEDPFSGGDILRLLQLEPFWRWKWVEDPDEGDVPQAHLLDVLPAEAQGTVLPLVARPGLVDAIQRAEVALYDLHHEQRSLYDRLDDEVVEACLAEVVEALRALGRRLRVPSLPELLPQHADRTLSLLEALAIIQRWKLAPEFDAAPDEAIVHPKKCLW